ncbi:MAG: hypothetical protein ACR2GC_07130 [Methyloceanibacter sp.]|uniref:hypothetical protein n=1 Tax=Methyloceanibacter sp. TaxID=1965321 RepID=UPI003D9AF99D
MGNRTLSPRQHLAWHRLIRCENVGPAFRALVNQFGDLAWRCGRGGRAFGFLDARDSRPLALPWRSALFRPQIPPASRNSLPRVPAASTSGYTSIF